jgi:hypothetical protein
VTDGAVPDHRDRPFGVPGHSGGSACFPEVSVFWPDH